MSRVTRLSFIGGVAQNTSYDMRKARVSALALRRPVQPIWCVCGRVGESNFTRLLQRQLSNNRIGMSSEMRM